MCCKDEIELGVYLEDERAVMPKYAYNDTSACFDLICIEDTIIPAHSSALIPVGLRIIIPESYYVEFATRSGHGISTDLRVHPGIIDHGYTGPWNVKMYNLGKQDVVIKSGKGCVQCKVHKKPNVVLIQALKPEFEFYREQSERKDGGMGSSDKKKD